MLSVQLISYGDPFTGLQVIEIPEPSQGASDVLVEVLARPINPSDLHFMQGSYGIKPPLPSSCGFEGMGRVVSAPVDSPLKPGQRISFTGLGSWQQRVCVSSSAIIPIPDEMSDATACQMFVNPCSAWAILQELNLKPGQWLAMTAGGSTLCQMIVRLASQRGINTICVVRRKDQADYLKELGATEVVVTFGEGFANKALEITDGRGVDAAIDAVGGFCGAEAISALATGGIMLVYGLLSGDNTPINNGQMIFKGLTVKGFWMTSWARSNSARYGSQMVADVMNLLLDSRFEPRVEASYPLAQVHEAVRHSMRSGRLGKVLLV